MIRMHKKYYIGHCKYKNFRIYKKVRKFGKVLVFVQKCKTVTKYETSDLKSEL